MKAYFRFDLCLCTKSEAQRKEFLEIDSESDRSESSVASCIDVRCGCRTCLFRSVLGDLLATQPKEPRVAPTIGEQYRRSTVTRYLGRRVLHSTVPFGSTSSARQRSTTIRLAATLHVCAPSSCGEEGIGRRHLELQLGVEVAGRRVGQYGAHTNVELYVGCLEELL